MDPELTKQQEKELQQEVDAALEQSREEREVRKVIDESLGE